MQRVFGFCFLLILVADRLFFEMVDGINSKRNKKSTRF
jgi:hypothetical protein